MVISLYTPKTNMEPNIWWFVAVYPFPRGLFQVHASFQGCIGDDILPKSFGVHKIALFSGSRHWPDFMVDVTSLNSREMRAFCIMIGHDRYIYISNQGIISPVYICKQVCHFRWYRKPPKKIPGTGPLKNSVVYHRQTTSRKKQRIVFHSSKRRPSFLDLEVSNWPIPIPSMGLVLYVPTFSWFLW